MQHLYRQQQIILYTLPGFDKYISSGHYLAVLFVTKNKNPIVVVVDAPKTHTKSTL